jgi:hypothetical protein
MDSEPNIGNKLARGKFTAVFLVQCLEAIGASPLQLSDGSSYPAKLHSQELRPSRDTFPNKRGRPRQVRFLSIS